MKELLIHIKKDGGKFTAKVEFKTVNKEKSVGPFDSALSLIHPLETALNSLLVSQISKGVPEYDVRCTSLEQNEQSFYRSRIQQYFFRLKHPRRSK